MTDGEQLEFPPILKDRIYEIIDRITRNETDFRDTLSKSWKAYSSGLNVDQQLLQDSFEIGYFVGYMEQYFRQLSFSILQRMPAADEVNYFIEILRNNMEKILGTIRR